MNRERTHSWDDPTPLWEQASALSGLEALRLMMSGELPQPPMARLMDIRLIEVEHGKAVFASTPGEHHYNPLGSVHGGFGATLLDSAMGCAVHSTLNAGDTYTAFATSTCLIRQKEEGR